MDKQSKWISDQPENLPDFIIGGAMKSGTTSLHAILDSHPDISIQRDELGFFDIDSIIQHPDFNIYNETNSEWISQSMETDADSLWNWYHAKFSELRTEGNLKGEDSTSYLASSMAAKRIAMQDKPIKMIFILRHPTQRTVSNYLHKLKSGRAIYSLEDTLRYEPWSILDRSLYKEQLEQYYKYLPFDRIKVVLFEDFIKDKRACIKSICEFLNIDFNSLDASVFETHSNKTRIPKYVGLQRKRNRWLRRMGDYRYPNVLPVKPTKRLKVPFWMRIIDRMHKMINPQKPSYTYKPKMETLKFLDSYFKSQLKGIDDVVQKDIYLKWFKD